MREGTVYTDDYGYVTEAQLKLYRQFNVSPADHDTLVEVYGSDASDEIVAAVRQYSRDGQYQEYLMISAAQRKGRI